MYCECCGYENEDGVGFGYHGAEVSLCWRCCTNTPEEQVEVWRQETGCLIETYGRESIELTDPDALAVWDDADEDLAEQVRQARQRLQDHDVATVGLEAAVFDRIKELERLVAQQGMRIRQLEADAQRQRAAKQRYNEQAAAIFEAHQERMEQMRANVPRVKE